MNKILTAFVLLSVFFLSCQEQDKRYLVVSKVKRAAKLATTETVVDKVVLGTQEKKLLGFIKVNKAHFAAYTQAIITSGIDMSELVQDDIVIDKKRIAINMPHVQVLDFSYPFDRYRIDSTVTRNRFLNKIDVLDHERFYMMAELDIRNNLQYTGIKESTEAKARQLMEGLLKNLGYEEIYITFKEGELIKPIEIEEGIED